MQNWKWIELRGKKTPVFDFLRLEIKTVVRTRILNVRIFLRRKTLPTPCIAMALITEAGRNICGLSGVSGFDGIKPSGG